VVNRIVELDRRQLIAYPGNYRRYLELRTRRHERLAAAEVKRQNLLRRELEWLSRGAMARSTKQKARKGRVEQLRRIRTDRGDETVAMLLAGRRLGKKVLEALDLAKVYDDLQIFEGVNLTLDRGDRIGIIGPNGAGKSTLLNILSGLTEPDTGMVTWGETVHLGYYDQLSRDLDDSKRVIDFINDKAPVIRTKDGRRVEAAQMLEWFLFPRPQQQALISALSGGERRRLYLLWVLVHQPNVLFLDEPTNDLDIQTLNVLEEFLDHFKGSLIVVSHDRYFLDRNVDFLTIFEGGSLSGRYPTPYSAYQQLVTSEQARRAGLQLGAGGKRSGRPASTQKNGPAEPQPRKLTWKEARELETVEARVAELETEKARLEEAVNQAGADYELLRTLVEQLGSLEAELESHLARWLELSEIG
jgi:ATP-binding cassette subfamily F protein uup